MFYDERQEAIDEGMSKSALSRELRQSPRASSQKITGKAAWRTDKWSLIGSIDQTWEGGLSIAVSSGRRQV